MKKKLEGKDIMTLQRKNLRKKKTERQLLIDKNDKLFREIIRRRDKYVCQRTGRTTKLQVSHFHTKSSLRTRWDEDNAVLLSAGVHYFGAHKYPFEFAEWYKNRLGDQRFFELNLKARYSSHISLFDLKYINSMLTERLKELEKG